MNSYKNIVDDAIRICSMFAESG